MRAQFAFPALAGISLVSALTAPFQNTTSSVVTKGCPAPVTVIESSTVYPSQPTLTTTVFSTVSATTTVLATTTVYSTVTAVSLAATESPISTTTSVILESTTTVTITLTSTIINATVTATSTPSFTIIPYQTLASVSSAQTSVQSSSAAAAVTASSETATTVPSAPPSFMTVPPQTIATSSSEQVSVQSSSAAAAITASSETSTSVPSTYTSESSSLTWTHSFYYNTSSVSYAATGTVSPPWKSGLSSYGAGSTDRSPSGALSTGALTRPSPSGYGAYSYSPDGMSSADAIPGQTTSSPSLASSGAAGYTITRSYAYGSSIGTQHTSSEVTKASTPTSKPQTTTKAVSSSASSTCGLTGPMTLDFDDLPVFGSDDTSSGLENAPPVDLTGRPYKDIFYFSDSAVYAPDPGMAFAPAPQDGVAPARLVAFDQPQGGELNVGSEMNNVSFWFQPQNVLIGCASTGGGKCSIQIDYHVYGPATTNETRHKIVEVNECRDNTQEECSLTAVSLANDSNGSPFGPISRLRFTPGPTDDKKPAIIYIDDLELTWYDNSCEAGQQRRDVQINGSSA